MSIRTAYLSIREKITSASTNASVHLRVKSALNCMLWAIGLVTAPGMIEAPLYPGGVPTWFIVIIFLPVIFACLGFAFLLIFNPDKLQSEDYQIRKQTLDLAFQKGDRFPINPLSLELIPNPRELTDGTSREGDK